MPYHRGAVETLCISIIEEKGSVGLPLISVGKDVRPTSHHLKASVVLDRYGNSEGNVRDVTGENYCHG